MTGETFGAMLRRIRVERDMGQSQLSRLAMFDASYVHQLEREDGRKRLPTRPVVLALAEALGMSYAERDRFLFIAGLAPETDWQTRAEDAEARLESVREALGMVADAAEPVDIRRRTG